MIKLNMYDVLVVGAGFAGAVIARKAADQGKKVLIVEKRTQIGGNMYECFDEAGIRIHLYGPHIFHTNNKEVFEFLKQYSEFYPYEHKVIGRIDGKLVPIPFNFTSLEMLFEKEKADKIKEKLKAEYPKEEKISILDLIKNEDPVIKEFGEFVFEKVFVHYTAKQWGIPIEEVDKSTINRVPVVLGYDERYFKDDIQYMPKEGFTKLFENMLDSENIEIQLNKNITEMLTLDFENKKVYIENEEFTGSIIFTGAVDELLDFKYGRLPYRSLDLVFENYPQTYYQTNSVVNYPNEEEFTRITEFKYLTNQEKENTTSILKEYPLKYDVNNKKCLDPYYPIINEENLTMYQNYKKEVEEFTNIHLVGRLAEYKYYNMDAVIARALEVSKEIEK